MENEIMNKQETQAEQMVNGVPARLYDGYDGDSGREPPEDFIQQLLDSAPPEVRARAEQFAQQRQAASGQAEPAASVDK
jgi:hypothetical protein